jgi:hypothetical protein
MQTFYEAPTAYLPIPGARSHSAPDDPSISIVVIDWGERHEARSEWEAREGVCEHSLLTMHLPVSQGLHRGFASHGVKPSHTVGEALRAIGAQWSGARL